MKALRAGITLSLAVALSSVPSTARAQVCGGSNFATCASVSISASDIGSGVVRIVMTVTNQSGLNGTYAGTIFGTMGLWGLGGYSYVSGSLLVTGAPLSNWGLGTVGLSGVGITANTAGVNRSGSIQNGLLPGQTATFQFDISGLTAAGIDVNDWAIHGLSGPPDLVNGGNCSTKLVSTDGSVNTGPYDPNCAFASAAPEPATMALLATGLAGIAGGAAARRRRRGITA